jgi:HD-GYP domain-containing protein (c-di-GMP phosphodiesterase class II)
MSRVIARGLQPRAFVVLVAAVATMVAAWTFREVRLTPAQVELAAILLAMAIAATQFPLQVTPSVKVNTSSAAYFAAALTLDPELAVLVVGLSQVAGGLLLGWRRNPLTGRPRRRFIDTVFNVSQWILATVAATLLFHLLAGASSQGTEWFAGVVAAGLAMYLVNTGLVAMVASLQRRVDLLNAWMSGRRTDAITEAGLYIIGATASVAVAGHPWVLIGLVIPTVLLHNSLHKTLLLQRQTVAAVEQMADLVDIRDGYTGQHSERVADRAEQIARRLRLSPDQVATIRLAARVHDIGKIAIPDRVLHKPGPLDEAEWELMKTHVDAGCRVLERFADYRSGLELVRSHHERVDGSGYPRGLDGVQVPLGAQVIAIADSIDAMTSQRPYRRPMPLSYVVAELERGAGSQFSSQVVAAALEVLGVNRGPVPGPSLHVRGALI